MANRLFTKIFGTRFDRELKRIQPIVDAIHKHEERLKDLSDSELQAQTARFREMIAQRTGALQAEVERVKQEKHDCPDPEKRADLSSQLARVVSPARVRAAHRSSKSEPLPKKSRSAA